MADHKCDLCVTLCDQSANTGLRFDQCAHPPIFRQYLEMLATGHISNESYKPRACMADRKEQLHAQIVESYRTRPSIEEFQDLNEETRFWIGNTDAVLQKVGKAISNQARSIRNDRPDKDASTPHGRFSNSMNSESTQKNYDSLEQTLINEISKLNLEIGPIATPIGEGQTFQYFDGIRKILETAKTEVFFVDPYIDADFIANYLAILDANINVRVLTTNKAKQKLSGAITAANVLMKQNNSSIEIRTVDGMHDRYLFIDGQSCHMTGASIKDGGKTAPTVIIKITDGYDSMHSTYNDKWDNGTVAT